MLKKILCILLLSLSISAQEPDKDIGGNTNLTPLEIPLTGTWAPDSTSVPGKSINFDDISNFRYTDKGIKVIDGYQRINYDTPVSSYPYIKSLYQYRSDGPTDYSILLAQADDGSGNSVVIQNNSSVPFVSGVEAPFVSYAENITNGTLETTGGWRDYGTPTTSEISGVDYHNGTHSYLYVSNGAGDGIQTAAANVFDIKGNTVYDLTFWVNATDDLQVMVINDSETSYAMHPVSIATGTAITDSEWSYVEISFISDDDVDDAKIVFYASTGTHYIDDVSLTAKYMLSETVSGNGHFSPGPNGSVLYTSGTNNYVWPGQESDVAQFLTVNDTSLNGMRDWTSSVQNESEDGNNVAYVGASVGSETVLLLHFDGNLTDDSATGVTSTAYGNTVYSSEVVKFGGYSLDMTVAGDYLSVADNAAWANTNSDYQIECWLNFTAITGDTFLYRQNDGTYYIQIYYDFSEKKFIFEVESSGSGPAEITLTSDEWVPKMGTWYHFQLSEVSNVYKMYIDGNQIGTVTDTDAWPNIAAALTIGGYSGCTDSFIGFMDEYRIVSTSTAGYVKNYEFQPNEIQYFGASESGCAVALIGTHYPVQAFKIYVPGYDWSDLTTTYVQIGTKDTWLPIYTISDNSLGARSDGWVTIPSSYVDIVDRKTVNNLELYWYKILYPAELRQIATFKVFCPMQEIPNIWDGVYISAASARVYNNSAATYYDYSDQVNSEVTTDIIDLSGLTSSDYVEIEFAKRVAGINVYISDENVNTTASTTLAVYYWDGWTYAPVTGLSDGTAQGGISLAKSGLITWTPPLRTIEHMYPEGYGQLFYKYKLVFDETLSSSVKPYYIEGIPVVENPPVHKFPLNFNNRAILCNLEDGASDILISGENAPFIYNGEDTVRYRIGGSEEIVSGIAITTLYDSELYNIALIHKKTETWQLIGNSPDDFKVSQLSDKIGCIAPNTVDSMQMSDGSSIAMWLSASGIVMSDGSNIQVMQGVMQYFDKSKPDKLINYSYSSASVGFFDPEKSEYNALIPIGSSTTNNLWVVYQVLTGKWFIKRPPQYFLSAAKVSDTNGAQYIYAGVNDGYVLRNEYTGAWLDTGSSCKTCDIRASVRLNEIELSSMWNKGWLEYIRVRGQNLPKRVNYDDDLSITESDASNKLTIASSTNQTVTFSDSGGSAAAYAYADMSGYDVGNWDEWAYTLKLNIDDITTSDTFYIFGLCESIGNFETLVDTTGDAGYGIKVLGTAAGVYRLEFEHWSGGSEVQTGTNTITGLLDDTDYYITIVKQRFLGHNNNQTEQYRLLGFVHTDFEMRNEIGQISALINNSSDVNTHLPYLYYFSGTVTAIGTITNISEVDYLAGYFMVDGNNNWDNLKPFGSHYDSELSYEIPKYEDIVRRLNILGSTHQIGLSVSRKWSESAPELYKIGLMYDIERIDSQITQEN